MISVEEYRALFSHVYAALGGCENIPASFSTFQERTEQADIEQDTAMRLFTAAYQDICKRCTHSLKHTLSYLVEHHPTNYRETIELIIWHGGHCDCEVIMNVDVANYAQHCNEPVDRDSSISDWEWHQMIDNYLLRAGYRRPGAKKTSADSMQQCELW